jgi:hypothetical protein
MHSFNTLAVAPFDRGLPFTTVTLMTRAPLDRSVRAGEDASVLTLSPDTGSFMSMSSRSSGKFE